MSLLQFLNNGYFAGKVGIGTDSPVAKLHVYQNDTEVDTAAGVTIEQDGTGDAALSFLLTGTRRWRMGIDNNDSDKFKISDSTNLASNNKLTIDTSGNVGIGTGSPKSTLNISQGVTSGAVPTTLTIENTDANILSGNDINRIDFFTNDGSTLGVAVQGRISSVAENNGNQAGLSFSTYNTTSLLTERMRIDNLGAVKFNSYSSTNQTGTPTYLLGTDASGNVVKTLSTPSPITSQAASLYDLIPNGAFTTTYAFTSTAGTYAEVMESNDVITATGTYSVQMFVDDHTVGGTQYDEFYSGVMTWFATGTNDGGVGAISEIPLHRAGHAGNSGIMYLRTRETTAPDNVLKLEIMCNKTYTGAKNVVFKFVRLI